METDEPGGTPAPAPPRVVRACLRCRKGKVRVQHRVLLSTSDPPPIVRRFAVMEPNLACAALVWAFLAITSHQSLQGYPLRQKGLWQGTFSSSNATAGAYIPLISLELAARLAATSSDSTTSDKPAQPTPQQSITNLYVALDSLQKNQERQGRELALLREEVRAGVALPPPKRQRTDEDDISDRPRLVAKGLLTSDDIELCLTSYNTFCAGRIQMLLPVPDINTLSLNSHLLSVALTLGLRASKGRAKDHQACLEETRQALKIAFATSTHDRDDRIHSCLLLSMWYADQSMWRLAMMEAHDARLYSSWVGAKEVRLAGGTGPSGEEELATMNRYRLWLSACSINGFHACFTSVPPLIQSRDLKLVSAETRARRLSGQLVDPWEIYTCATVEMYETWFAAQDSFATFRHPDLVIDDTVVARLRELNIAHDVWSQCWVALAESVTGSDTNGIKVAGCLGRTYINNIALARFGPTTDSLDASLVHYIQLATESAMFVLNSAVTSTMFQATIYVAIDYSLKNSLALCGSFLLHVCTIAPMHVDVLKIAGTLQEVATRLQADGPQHEPYIQEYARMHERINEMIVQASQTLSRSTSTSPATGTVPTAPSGGHDRFDSADYSFFEPGEQWSSMFTNLFDEFIAEPALQF